MNQTHPAGAPAPPPRKGLAVASLVLGLLSVPTFGLLLVGAILALVFGIVALVKANRHPAQYGGQGMAVAGIVASVVSVLVMPMVMGIAAAIAIPTMLRKRVAANETAAIADVREVVAAQHAYGERNGGYYDTLQCLAEPAPCIPGYDGPAFIDQETASLTPRNGYTFRFDTYMSAEALSKRHSSSPQVPVTSFAYVAVPIKQGQTGVRAFCGDASGRICFTVDGTMPEPAEGTCPADCTSFR